MKTFIDRYPQLPRSSLSPPHQLASSDIRVEGPQTITNTIFGYSIVRQVVDSECRSYVTRLVASLCEGLLWDNRQQPRMLH